MADTAAFFSDFLPKKLNDASIRSIGKVYLFDIQGAGQWTLDLAAGTVSEGAPAGKADCTVTCEKSNWEKLLDNPGLAMQLFMTKKLTVSDLGLGTKLQQILK